MYKQLSFVVQESSRIYGVVITMMISKMPQIIKPLQLPWYSKISVGEWEQELEEQWGRRERLHG
jgi:hypothetical protein